jgi:hypothetical protein
MPTQQEEETQAKEFLKRAEIKTMRKDLSVLREADSLKERNKIAKIKTIEEQQAEYKKQLAEKQKSQIKSEKSGLDQVLLKNEKEEYFAEKDLKNDATEQERQQIFLFESKRIGFEKEIDDIENKKNPALKLEKNNLLLQITNWHKKLSEIIDQEKKLEDEQKVIIDKEQTTAVPTERKGLEQRRSDLDKQIQDIEKKRWDVEKQIQDIENKIKIIDQSSQQFVVTINELRDKILGIDKSLREIYSVIIARFEERRRGQAEDQKLMREAIEKRRLEENEKVQRAQWGGKNQNQQKGFMGNAPESLREKMEKNAKAEEEQRKKFLHDVGQASEKAGNQQLQNSNTKL